MLRFLILFAVLLLDLITHAQLSESIDKYYVEHFGEEEGLQNTIYSILPDKDDFLWIATSNGIVRFNGSQVLPISIKGTIYRNSYNNFGSLHYSNNNSIMAFSAFLEKIAVISGNKIVGIKDLQIEQTGLLFSNQRYRVQAPAYITGNIYKSEFGKKIKWDVSTYSLIGGVYNKDTIWIVSTDGIGFYDKNGLVNKINIPAIDVVRVVSVGNYIFYLDKGNYLNYYTPQGLRKRELIDIPVHHNLSIFNNRFGDGFYCVADSSLYKADITVSNLSFRKIMEGLKRPADITVVFEKDLNTIITGTSRNGLFIYKKKQLKVSGPLSHDLPNNFFMQYLLPDSQTIFTGRKYLFKNGLYYNKKIKGFEHNYYGILKDHEGQYWYADNEYILRTNEIGAAADTIAHINGQYPEILLEDKDGRIWIGSEIALGYIQDDKYIEVRIKKLSGRRVTCMKQDASSRYLIGTDWGFFVWNNIYEPDANEISNFRSTHVRNIIPEADGSVWVFTYGNGFFLMTKDTVTSLSDNNKNLAFVHTLIEDERGYCWLPSNNGLFVTTKKSLLEYSKDKTKQPFFYSFSMKDGLRTNEFNGGTEPSYLRLSNGDISLTSMDGLISFNPSKMHFSFSTSSILLNQVRLDSAEIEESDTFKIGNDVKNIHFSISTSYWGFQENHVLEYQVKEKEGEPEKGQWLKIDEAGEINLFSPGYGNYQLIIRKRTGLGTNDYLYKTISFHVLPKWYQTKIFLLAVILGVIGLMIGIFFWRRDYYRKANRILKERVNVATLELQQMNNTLEKKVEERTSAIQEAEKRFRILVEKSLVGVYIVQDKKFLYVNPRYEEIFGYDRGELYRVSPFSIIKEDLQGGTNEKIMQFMSGEIDSEHSETIGVKKDGTERLLEFYASRTMYEGKPIIIGTVLDITEKKLLEQEITEQKVQEQKKITRAILQGEERERNKIGQELHDNINQILAVTKMSLSRAKKATANKEDVITESMLLIDNVIEEIRSLSRDKVTPLRKVDLRELLQSLIETMTANYDINATLVYNGEDSLLKDELKLNIYRVTQELLNNILKHAMADNLTVSVEAGASQINLSVSDDGKGFDPEIQGRGIGISNMVNRVESFNGILTIESSHGNGCRTTVTFPIKQSGYLHSVKI